MNFFGKVILFSIMLVAFVAGELRAISLENGEKNSFCINEIGIGSGYGWGGLKNSAEDLTVYPAFVRIGFNINSFVGIEGGQSLLQLALEPFVNGIDNPELGVETGCGIGVRYLHDLSAPVDVFVEGSVAPMFLSIDTHEQGKAGFNFLTQIGAGFQYNLTGRTALFAGYRFRHLSHGGLADRSNMGINSIAIVFGVSLLY